MENSTIKVNRILDTNYSLKRKIVKRNNKNCYISTSLSTCNTSRKDGLLVCKNSKSGSTYQVLLSHLDEVVMNNACFYQLAYHQYSDCFFPNGLKYIRNVETDSGIVYYYAFSNIVLKKEITLNPNSKELICTYALEEACNEIDLVIKPLLAFRNIYSLNKNTNRNFKVSKEKNSIKITESKDYPALLINCSDKFIFTEKDDWYHNFVYQEDKQKGQDYSENLFMPGQILISLKQGQSFSMRIGLDEIENKKYSYENEYLKNENKKVLSR